MGQRPVDQEKMKLTCLCLRSQYSNLASVQLGLAPPEPKQ